MPLRPGARNVPARPPPPPQPLARGLAAHASDRAPLRRAARAGSAAGRARGRGARCLGRTRAYARRPLLGRPEGAEVDGGVSRCPALEEPVDRRMQDELGQLVRSEQAMTAHGGVVRGDGLERPAAEVAGEDDVDDVLGCEAAHGRDRVDDRDRPFDRHLVGDTDLLGELAVQRVDERLARVDSPTGQKPAVAAGLFMPAEEDPPLPAQHRGDADAWLRAHQSFDEPNPRTPRSLSGSDSTSTVATSGTGTTTSWAIRIPGSTTNDSRRSVFSNATRISPR